MLHVTADETHIRPDWWNGIVLVSNAMKPVWQLPLQAKGIDVALESGRLVRIRPVREGDRAGLLAAFAELSERSRYLRFFSGMTEMPEGVIDALANVDHRERIAWGVFDPEEPSLVGDDSGLAIASARLFVDHDDRSAAEATLAVADAYQRIGMGKLLMELLISTALMFEIETLRFDVLRENRGMRRLLGNVGATGTALPDDPTILRYHLTIASIPDADPTAGALYELLRSLPEVES